MSYLSLMLLLATTVVSCRPGGPEADRPRPIPRDEEPVERTEPEDPVEEPAPDGDRAVALGVIVPQSGSPYLERYGKMILRGVRLAVDEYREAGGRPVELVVVDNAGAVERAGLGAERLERQRVIGIVGPLRTAAVAAAARARRGSAPVVVTPTAPDVPQALDGVYSLRASGTRGARALADYALRAGLTRVAVLSPASGEFARRAEAFAARVRRGGGTVAALVPYDSATTTFGPALQRILEERPQAIYIPAPRRDVRQIAPQLAYYGLDTLGIQILGGRAWANERVRRIVEPRYLEGVIAATPLPKSSPRIGWRDFVDRYERTYRRSLDAGAPALGYDAARLILAAVPARGRASPETVARRLARISGLRAATGILSVRDGRVTRRPFLVQIRGGELVPAPPPRTLGMPPDTVEARP